MMEPMVAAAPEKALAVSSQIKINFVRQSIPRRILATASTKSQSRKNTQTNNVPPKRPNAAFEKELKRLAPGFNIGETGKYGIEYLSSYKNKQAIKTHPVNKNTEFYFWREFKVSENKKTRLKMNVSFHPHGDFQLKVKLNKDTVKDIIISSKTVKNEWLEIDIDLSKYAGKHIHLRIENYPNDWHWEYAYWNYIKVVSE